MSERSELLKHMAVAYALGDVAIPYSPQERDNPAMSGLDAPARELADLMRYAASHPDDPSSEEIRSAFDLIAKVLACAELPPELPH